MQNLQTQVIGGLRTHPCSTVRHLPTIHTTVTVVVHKITDYHAKVVGHSESLEGRDSISYPSIFLCFLHLV